MAFSIQFFNYLIAHSRIFLFFIILFLFLLILQETFFSRFVFNLLLVFIFLIVFFFPQNLAFSLVFLGGIILDSFSFFVFGFYTFTLLLTAFLTKKILNFFHTQNFFILSLFFILFLFFYKISYFLGTLFLISFFQFYNKF